MALINLRGEQAEYAMSLIDWYGDIHQSMIAVEELSELQKELIKSFRGKADIQNITEELGDAIFTLWQVKKIYRISDEDLYKVIQEKCVRAVSRMNASSK